jgi:hypothetical protein
LYVVGTCSLVYSIDTKISGLAAASETKIPLTPPDNAQRDIAALQTQAGVIWVFTSTGMVYSTERNVYYYTYDGSLHAPTPVPGTDYGAHISALDYGGNIWLFYDIGYSLYLISYDETTLAWSSPTHITDNATLGKAI